MKELVAAPVQAASVVYSWLLALYCTLTTPTTASAAASSIPTLTRRSRRGVTFLEYAIMAAIIIGVGLFVLNAATGVITGLWNNVTDTWTQFSTNH